MSRGDSVLATRCIGQAVGALVGASAAPMSTEFDAGDRILSPAFADQNPYARAYNTDNILLNRGGPYRTDTTTGAVECMMDRVLVPCGSNAQSAAPAPKRQRHARP
jgi:hypothetical protein